MWQAVLMNTYGFLAIWCDISDEYLADYRNWLTQEHIADRTFSPGFLSVRLFEKLDDPNSHFILYATENPEVLDGPEYKAILDTPSDWTRRLMPEFERFDRALGTQVLKIGNGFGSCVAIWRLSLNNAAVDLNELGSRLTSYLGSDGVVSVRLNALNHATTDRHSEEKTMRGGTEGGFDYLLCAEVMNEDQVTLCEQRLTAALPKLFPKLSGFDSSCRRMFYGEAAHEGPT